MADLESNSELDAALAPSVRARLEPALRAPLRDILGRPSKRIRSEMVIAGYALAGERAELQPSSDLEAHRLSTLAEALEAIHAGSLVVDDIQDGSRERRGAPALHRSYGVPVALNAGNALYFWPLEWIRALELPESLELRLYRLAHAAIFRAHLGQALDLGSPMDEIEQEGVPAICAAALELKTGELMALAFGAGAALGGASPGRLAALMEFGKRFGVALQAHDDLGNLDLPLTAPKRLEDLRLRRPTWVWSEAARLSSAADYERFREAVRALPDETALFAWLDERRFRELAKADAGRRLERALAFLREELGADGRFERALGAVQRAADQISSAYA